MSCSTEAVPARCPPQVVVYAKTPAPQRAKKTLMCFPSEFTEYVFCVNAAGTPLPPGQRPPTGLNPEPVVGRAGRKWDISKRFKDFLRFEAKLVKSFSEEQLAGREPMPEKNYFLSNSPSFVEHRRWRLEMYINSLAHCPAVAQSDVFREFLESDQNGFTVGEIGDDTLAGLNAYDREQERIKMEKLAELAKLPTRPLASEMSNSSLPSSAPGTPAIGESAAA